MSRGAPWFALVYCGVFLGITSVVMWQGVKMMETGEEYEENETKETCLLVDYDEEECTYDCNCDGRGNNCDNCYGTRYSYSATVESKCGNETLFQRENPCPGNFIKLNTEKTCYVPECGEEEFSFYSSSILTTGGEVVIVFASLLFCCGLCGICYLILKWHRINENTGNY